jgi:O-methyltransferase
VNLSIIYDLAEQCPESVSVDRLVAIHHQLSSVLDLRVPGAVVELGCYRGATSEFIGRVIDAVDPGRELHLFDTFAGLPEPGHDDGVMRVGELKAQVDEVRTRFRHARLKPPFLHRGRFSDTLLNECPKSICFAYVDADLEHSIHDALHGIYHHLSRGGVVLIDDYCNPECSPRCWGGLPGVRKAVDRFFVDKPERVVCLVGTGDLSMALARKL